MKRRQQNRFNTQPQQYRVGNPEYVRAEAGAKHVSRRAWICIIVIIILEALLFSGCLLYSVIVPSAMTDYYITIIGCAGGPLILLAVIIAGWIW